jgi:hypothetical protein
MASGLQYIPKKVIRNDNYIGKSNWNNHANITFDEFKIFDRALNITEIEDDFNIKQIPFKKTSLSIFIILIVTFCLPQSTVGIKAKLSKMKN